MYRVYCCIEPEFASQGRPHHLTRIPSHQVHAQQFLSYQAMMELNFWSFHQKTVIEIVKNNKDSTLGRSMEMYKTQLYSPAFRTSGESWPCLPKRTVYGCLLYTSDAADE